MMTSKPSMWRGLVAASLFLAVFCSAVIGFRVVPNSTTTERGGNFAQPITTDLYAVHVIGCATHDLHFPVPISFYVPGDYVVALTPEQYASISAAYTAVGAADELVRSLMYLP